MRIGSLALRKGSFIMEILEAKKLVIEAGKKLLKSGLIARTWGNVSCRVSPTQFVITPSGRAYETLTPDEIVLVNIADCSYEGTVKPSSEKGIHASVYEMRPEMDFVIHTHQPYASAAAAIGYDINSLSQHAADLIGPGVTVASYGLPGTGKLKNGVRDAMMRSPSKAILMAHHGALCMGEDMDEAFAVAAELEKVCEKFILDRFYTFTGTLADNYSELTAYFADLKKGKKNQTMPAFDYYDSSRQGATAVLVSKKDGSVIRVNLTSPVETTKGSQDYTPAVDLHKAVYNNRDDVNYIHHSDAANIKAFSAQKKALKPYLDDFAQLIGLTCRTAVFNPADTIKSSKQVVKKLKGRNAVMLKDNGALCVSGDKDDAEAIEMVLNKNINAAAATAVFPGVSVINKVESALMRVVYKTKYSKQKNK